MRYERGNDLTKNDNIRYTIYLYRKMQYQISGNIWFNKCGTLCSCNHILLNLEREHKGVMYKKCVKRLIDVVLSTVGIVVLIPVWIILAIAIKADDPGPVFFRQKRIGENRIGADGKAEKQFFQIYKFRSMKTSTPCDVPTHMMENPEQYITRVGKFLRKTSLDELPQIFNIWLGQMSIIGPRPALWNQDDLYDEREKYGVNDVRPGLTGWAQVNGRDELEIEDKARLDGEYVEKLNSRFFTALFFDIRCFVKTIFSVLKSDGVVEGGTGNMRGRGQIEEEKVGR